MQSNRRGSQLNSIGTVGGIGELMLRIGLFDELGSCKRRRAAVNSTPSPDLIAYRSCPSLHIEFIHPLAKRFPTLGVVRAKLPIFSHFYLYNSILYRVFLFTKDYR